MKTTHLLTTGGNPQQATGKVNAHRNLQPKLPIPARNNLFMLFAWIGLLMGVFSPQQVRANHMLGSDITYECQPNGCSYQINHTLYLDCTTVGTLPPPAGGYYQLDYGFYTTAGAGSVTVVPTGVGGTAPAMPPASAWTQQSAWQDVTPVCNIGQTTCQPGGSINGVMAATFSTVYDLCGSACSAVNLHWTAGARSANISSGAANMDMSISGITIPLGANACNSTPQFNNLPIAYICAGQTSYYTQGATDPDGDVLTYSLGNCMAAPGTSVNYNPLFSGTSPLGPGWNVSINPTTGIITFSGGGSIVNAVLCIYVTETRNGNIINQIVRDMNVLVMNCNGGGAANLSPTTVPNSGLITNGISGLTSNATLTTSGPASSTITACAGQVIAFNYQIQDLSPNGTASGQQVSINWNWSGGGGLPSFGPFSNPIPMNTNHTYTANNTYTLGFNWPSGSVVAGTYFLNIHLQDDNCPIIGQNDYVIEFIIYPQPIFAATVTNRCLNAVSAGIDLVTTLPITPLGGTYSCTTPGGIIVGNIFTANALGPYIINYTSPDGCSTSTTLMVLATLVLNNTAICYNFVSGNPNTISLFATFGVSPPGQFLQNGNPVNGYLFPLNPNPNNEQQDYNDLSYVAGNCTSTVATLTINPTPIFTYTSFFPTCLSTAQAGIDLATNLPAIPTGGAYTSSVPGVMNGDIFTTTSAGTYTITYTVNGCSQSTSIVIKPTPSFNLVSCHNFVSLPNSINLVSALSPSPAGGQFYQNGSALSGNMLPLVSNAGNVVQTYPGITYIANGCTSVVNTITLNPVPIVTSSSASKCLDEAMVGLNLAAIFTASPAGGTYSCASGSVSITNNILTTNIAGTYTITYTVNSCSKNVTLIVKPLPIINNASSCYATSTVNLFTTFSPSPSGGTFALNGTSVNSAAFPVTAGQTYSPITYTQGGCTSLPVALTVNFTPSLSPSTTTACLSDAIAGIDLGNLFSVNPAGAAGGTYTCSAPGTVTGTIFTASSAGTYTITYTTQNNCLGTANLVISPAPVISPSNPSVCYIANSNNSIDLTSIYTTSPAFGTFEVFDANGISVYTGNGSSFTPPQLGTFGNYTVTYTAGIPACSVTESLTINEQPVLANPTLSICNNNATDLATLMQPQPGGGVFGPSNYVQTNANGAFLQVPTGAGGNFPITYTYTNPNGQTCTTSGNIYVPPVVTITGNNNLTLCSAGANTPIDLNLWLAPVTNPTTPGYFIGAGVSGGNIFTPNGIGSYTVTYVVVDALGCLYRMPFTFQINDCCNYSNYMPMGNNGQTTTLSSLIASAALPSNPAIAVQRTFSGKLVVDIPYVFNSSHLILCPGAEIEVNPGIKFRLMNGTIVEGNTAMWKGIKNYGQLGIQNSTVRDAEFAVNEQISGNTNISNALFDRNFVGILGNPNTIFGQFWGNTFDCVGCSGTSVTSMLPPYAGQSNWATFSRAGIQLNASTMIIGQPVAITPPNTLNFFRNSMYGIESYSSHLTVLNSSISHADWITPPTSIVSPPAASGIYAFRSSVDVTGMGNVADAFHHCHYGLFIDRSQYTRIRDCKMDYTNTSYPMIIGIHTQNTPYGNISLDNNIIHATKVGINSLYDENADHFRIFSNTIDMNQASATQLASAAIRITELAQTGKCMINQNIINLDQCYTGVQLNTTTSTDVRKNTININSNIVPPAGQPSQRVRGIWLMSGSRQNVSCNDINYPLATNNDAYGIDVRAAIFSRYMNNHTKATNEGLHISDQCYQLGLRSNWFEEHEIGLHLTSSAFIGNQIYMGNLWWDPTTSTQAQHDGSSGVYSQSYFKVSPNPLSFPLPLGFITAPDASSNPNNLIPSSGWFGYGAEEDSAIVIDCPQPQFDFSYRVKMDSLAAQGDIPTDLYPVSTNWTTDALLYERLEELKNTEWNNTFFEEFYKKEHMSSIGKLQEIQQSTKQVFVSTKPTKTILQNYAENLSELSEELGNINQDEVEEIMVNEKKVSISKEIQQFQRLAIPLEDDLAKVQAISIDVIRSRNANIVGDKVYELNEKIVNNIYLATIAKGLLQLTGEQAKLIEDISNQCPIEGGRAVYRARSIYQLVNPNKIWSDEILCKETSIKQEVHDNKQLSDSFSKNFVLVPNPANELVNLRSLDNQKWVGKIEILSPIGQVVYNANINHATTEQLIDISSLAAGMYYCHLYDKEGKSLFTGKLFVSH